MEQRIPSALLYWIGLYPLFYYSLAAGLPEIHNGYVYRRSNGKAVLAMANSSRCLYNGEPVENGLQVENEEPCLNCTCSDGVLLCHLQTCPTIVSPSKDCQVTRETGHCCPRLRCKEPVYASIRAHVHKRPYYKFHGLPEDGRPLYYRPLIVQPAEERGEDLQEEPVFVGSNHNAEYSEEFNNRFRNTGGPWTTSTLNPFQSTERERRPQPQNVGYGGQVHLAQEEDQEPEDEAQEDSLTGDCYSRGYKYSEGMAMLSPTTCEYCYCIRGQQMCVRPKCHLNIGGCQAKYHSGFTCCPSHYECDSSSQGENDNYASIENTIRVPVENRVSSCKVEGQEFKVGVAVPAKGHCQTCYCTQIGVVCRRLECSPTVDGCTPVVPEGHCCPTEYTCEEFSTNSTRIPISHSTDNYDVTVISPSSHTTSTLSDSEHSHQNTRNSITSTESQEETTTGSDRITVRISEDSDLESVSVIPEEKLAILVLTTEEDQNVEENGTTAADINADEQTVTPPIVEWSTTSSKGETQTTLPVTIVVPSSSNTEVTGEIPTTNTATSTTSGSEPVTRNVTGYHHHPHNPDYYYDDDYHHDDEDYYHFSHFPQTQRNTETFSPFSEAEFQERVSTKASIASTGVEPTASETYETSNNAQEQSTGTTESRTEKSTRIPTTIIAETTEPIIYAETPATDNTEGISRTTAAQTREYYLPDTSPHTFPADTTTRLTTKQTYRPFRPDPVTPEKRSTFPSSETPKTTKTATDTHYSTTETQNYRTSQTTTSSTIPSNIFTQTLPLNLAELLWAITKFQASTTTREQVEDTTATSEEPSNDLTKHPVVDNVETTAPLALAAPKLIVEQITTVQDGIHDQQKQVTMSADNSNSTLFNPSSPHIVFSNHGPAGHKRPSTRPRLPTVMSNHSPPQRQKPFPSRIVSQKPVIEFSNHQPGAPLRRPPTPSKARPRPGIVQKLNLPKIHSSHRGDLRYKIHRLVPDLLTNDKIPNGYFDTSDGGREIANFDNYPKQESELRMENGQQMARNPQSPLENEPLKEENKISHPENKPSEKSESAGDNEESKEISDEEREIADDIESSQTTTTTESWINSAQDQDNSGSVDNFKPVVDSEDSLKQEITKLSRAEDDPKDDFISSLVKLRPSGGSRPIQSLPEVNPVISIANPTSVPESNSQEISDVCFVDGRYYKSGEVIVKKNPCEMCRCFYGHPLCQIQQCPTPPDPTCTLEHLPGFCCPRITCRSNQEDSESSEGKSPKREISLAQESDNQWKPLPNPYPPELPSKANDQPPSNSDSGAQKESDKSEPNPSLPNSLDDKNDDSLNEVVDNLEPARPDDISNQILELNGETMTQEPPSGTEPTPVFNPVEDKPAEEDTTSIHDNSSGGRKVLDSAVVLPASKVSPTPVKVAEVDPVLPLVHEVAVVPPIDNEKREPNDDTVIMDNDLQGGMSVGIGGNLKVSGCNVYGKYYKINDKVSALSKPCYECVCKADGISCNTTC